MMLKTPTMRANAEVPQPNVEEGANNKVPQPNIEVHNEQEDSDLECETIN